MSSQEPYYYVVNNNGKLLGSLSTHLVKNVLSPDEDLNRLIIARDLLVPAEAYVTPDTNLADCMDQFERVESEHLPVVDDEKNKNLIGIISKKEIFKLYNREILRKDMLGIKYVRDLGSEKQRNLVQLPSEYKVDYVSVPEHYIGKTLKELNIRAMHNVTILAVKKKLSDIALTSEMPNPDRVFEPGDILIVAGKDEDVDRIRKISKSDSV